MSVSEIYTQLVLEHNRAPRNFGPLSHCTHAANGDNQLCGDHLHIELQVENGVVEKMGFSGESCAVTMAAASMLTDVVRGKNAAQIKQLAQAFERTLRGSHALPADNQWGDLSALMELRNYPARIICALLPWATVQSALQGNRSATTEVSK